MEEFVKVAVDAMGGDNAPAEIIKGAVEAIQESNKDKSGRERRSGEERTCRI